MQAFGQVTMNQILLYFKGQYLHILQLQSIFISSTSYCIFDFIWSIKFYWKLENYWKCIPLVSMNEIGSLVIF